MGWFDLRFVEDESKILSECEFCNRPMFFPKSKAGLYKTCGGSCDIGRRSAMRGKRERKCVVCGAAFIARSTQLRNGGGLTCSQKCNFATNNAVKAQEAQARARSTWMAKHKLTPIIKRGPDNPKWTGGRAAVYRRRRDSGATRIACANRKLRFGGNKLSTKLAQRLGQMQRWKCAICKCCVKDKFELDHIKPLFLGGLHVDSNIQLLCRRCNRKKHAKDPIEYMQSLGFLL